MLPRLSVKKRIYSGLVLLCTLVIIGYSFAIKFSSDYLEDLILDSTFKDELKNIEKSRIEGELVLPDSSHVHGFLASQGNVPLEFLQHETGAYHDIVWKGDHYHLYVKSISHELNPNDTLYLVIQINAIEHYEENLNTILIAAAISLLIASLWAAYWLTSFIVHPVSELSRQVSQLTENDEKLPASLSDTDLAPIEEAINHYLKSIQEYIRKEKNFSGIASHELRTPISTIRSSLDTFLQSSDSRSLQPKQLERIQRAMRAVMEMQYITESLLLLVKHRKKLEQEKNPYSLAYLLNELIEEHRVLLRSPEIKISLVEAAQVDTALPHELMKVIIGNLLRNALENTLKGEIRLTLNEHSIVIADSGVGLPDNIMEWINSPLNGNELQKNLGIGLFLVKEFCKQLELTLEVRKNELAGNGTLFELSWK